MVHGNSNFDKKYYKRFFDKYTKSEFDMYVNWADGWVRFLDKYVDIKRGERRSLHELGASLGYFSRIFKNRGFDVTGSDISSFIVGKAGKIQKDIKFFKFDVEKDSTDKKYDFVVAFEVLEHLKNPEKSLKNIRSMLKKGGTLVFSTPFPTKRSLTDPTHINVHPAFWWVKKGKSAGFSGTKVVYATFIPLMYRISKYFSFGFPIKTNLPYINSTCFLVFRNK
ncbi:MAG: Methyltransferase type 11 [Candidatus Woesebacteria bacterium GW2011_GWB1_39_10]|uniref:Methyltransferase type 11 n=2 Tax=Candidatus Woeseibacteriota TaxID=1752722 RepID=A0A0G0LUX8_9BACT|nr:MAG: Methyltransferase type 11 [Candidatus Woesebacteria bacterium GW2011_GWB1_39_10]